MNSPIINPESTGPRFSLDTFQAARKTCKNTLDTILNKLQVGMTEPDLQKLVKDEFLAIGVDKFWHPTKARIGTETIKTFRAPANPDVALNSGDLCFLDIGPIINDHETDFGRTIIFNSEKTHPIIQACETVFNETTHFWKTEKPDGQKLYEFARVLSEKMGYQLNPKMAGHRLGDFPHHIYYKDSLANFTKKPMENLWVLEIHLIDPVNNIGAFYEDLLT